MDGNQLNMKKWIILYPVYINSKKTIAEGRRISVDKACENPTCMEIADCCRYLNLAHHLEDQKAYPRDFMQRGRLRVKLKNEDGTLCNPEITSSKDHRYDFMETADAQDCRVSPKTPWKGHKTGAIDNHTFHCRPFQRGKGGKKEEMING
ncbi:signal recognition particle 19kDa [Asimina triloba]